MPGLDQAHGGGILMDEPRDIVKTFTHNGRAWGLQRDRFGRCDLVRRDVRGQWIPADGTSRLALEAWAHVKAQWPEYVGDERKLP